MHLLTLVLSYRDAELEHFLLSGLPDHPRGVPARLLGRPHRAAGPARHGRQCALLACRYVYVKYSVLGLKKRVRCSQIWHVLNCVLVSI